ncbi:DUF3012 domain-containing protein [Microbulbifer sp. ARAS458-1]|uniref:DUF3012 domain-containing protein n=1 Tax=Microbulbifer sp. ARAS458-1 TaxID=3140242 RepID=UPI003877FE7C
MKKIFSVACILSAAFLLTACEPKRGSDAWCKKMDETPKGDWSFKDAGDYTKYCVLNQKPEDQ